MGNGPRNTSLIQINTAVFLSRMRKKYGRGLTLEQIPSKEWISYKKSGFDFIWLMGVWQRSPAAKAHALERFRRFGDYRNILSDIREEDITGSAYAVYDYQLDSSLGPPKDLLRLRKKLSRLGLKLILDFVPNHLAFDHPWTLRHPDRFVRLEKRKIPEHPEWFFKTSSGDMLAHGRDPYFPPWADTVQINFFSRDSRDALIRTVLDIAETCDGIRCDMAMLGLNEIFRSVWRGYVREQAQIKAEFWEEMIQRVKSKFPNFIFMAEVYWDYESKLLELGFDYAYDKKFYDKLKYAPPNEIRDYLKTDISYQSKMLRFVENHDEDRAVVSFGRERSWAAAAVTATVPGFRFFHEGQTDGKRVKVPVQLRREPDEPEDKETAGFYRKLCEYLKLPVLRTGRWQLLETAAVAGQEGVVSNILAWEWVRDDDGAVIAVNYSPLELSGHILLPVSEKLRKRRILFLQNMLDGLTSEFELRKVEQKGIPVILEPWQVCLWKVKKKK